jgi:predicted acetyltransferase
VTLRLRPLGLADEPAFLLAQEEMEREGFSFGFDYDPGMPWADYVARLAAQRRGVGLAPGRVRSATLVADVGGVLVGRTSIRLDLNAWLAEVGGHIGYCVLPAYRRRGHATEVLRQSLAVAREAGIPRALLTCDEDNTGSRLVIERCGGIFERHSVSTDNPDGPPKRRYWVPTLGS